MDDRHHGRAPYFLGSQSLSLDEGGSSFVALTCQGQSACSGDEVTGSTFPAEGREGGGCDAAPGIDRCPGVVEAQQDIDLMQLHVGGAEAGEVGAVPALLLGDFGRCAEAVVGGGDGRRAAATACGADGRHEVQHAEGGQPGGAGPFEVGAQRVGPGGGVLGSGAVPFLVDQAARYAPGRGADGHRVAGGFGSGQRTVGGQHSGRARGGAVLEEEAGRELVGARQQHGAVAAVGGCTVGVGEESGQVARGGDVVAGGPGVAAEVEPLPERWQVRRLTGRRGRGEAVQRVGEGDYLGGQRRLRRGGGWIGHELFQGDA
ncbi:hypothetical protein [Streptomyces sp. 8K308]|uniref:hypothetical protein n=1 Tax=Streptomyces sp. 8K308 TaxID=2530388 RepID=UPI001FB82503|nr:hypothetical protein [Streptomyces sp. 8K308]